MAVIAAARFLGNDRPTDLVAEFRQGGGVVADAPLRRGQSELVAELHAHQRLVLRVDQRLGARTHGHAVTLEFAEQLGGHMLVVEGNHVDGPGEGLHRRGVGVVADRDVVDHLRGTHIGTLCQQLHLEPQADC